MKRLSLLLSLIFFTLICCKTSLACSCEPPSQRNVVALSAAVFVGEVVDIQDSDVPLFKDSKPSPKSSHAVTFRVRSYWKGIKGSEVVVHSDLGGLPCNQFAFEKGKRYLVYATGKNLIALTGCTRSHIADDGQYYRAELRGLGPGKIPK